MPRRDEMSCNERKRCRAVTRQLPVEPGARCTSTPHSRRLSSHNPKREVVSTHACVPLPTLTPSANAAANTDAQQRAALGMHRTRAATPLYVPMHSVLI
eukprot:4343949-Pleurochrysis_carterae.AAC.1